jgi:ribosomal protein S20
MLTKKGNEPQRKTKRKDGDKAGMSGAAAAAAFGCSSADKSMIEKLKNAFNNARSKTCSKSECRELGQSAAEKIAEANKAVSSVDEQLFGEKVKSGTTALTGEAIGHVNDEARNAPEEEYIAYLDGDDVKPKIQTEVECSGRYGKTEAMAIVRTIKSRNKTAIDRIRSALQFQGGKRTAETYGLRSGDLDEGSLHKLSYDCDHISVAKDRQPPAGRRGRYSGRSVRQYGQRHQDR